MLKKLIFFIFILKSTLDSCESRVDFKNVVSNDPKSDPNSNDSKKILLAIQVKNHIHSFPTFLATLESMKCPNKKTDKCDLWIIFDNCTDQSYETFVYWLGNTRTLFDSIIMLETKNDVITRQKHVINIYFLIYLR